MAENKSNRLGKLNWRVFASAAPLPSVLARVTPLVATLGTNSILYGAALVYTGGAPHGSISPGFAVWGQGHVVGLPVSTVCWLAIGLAKPYVVTRNCTAPNLPRPLPSCVPPSYASA